MPLSFLLMCVRVKIGLGTKSLQTCIQTVPLDGEINERKRAEGDRESDALVAGNTGTKAATKVSSQTRPYILVYGRDLFKHKETYLAVRS